MQMIILSDILHRLIQNEAETITIFDLIRSEGVHFYCHMNQLRPNEHSKIPSAIEIISESASSELLQRIRTLGVSELNIEIIAWGLLKDVDVYWTDEDASWMSQITLPRLSSINLKETLQKRVLSIQPTPSSYQPSSTRSADQKPPPDISIVLPAEAPYFPTDTVSKLKIIAFQKYLEIFQSNMAQFLDTKYYHQKLKEITLKYLELIGLPQIILKDQNVSRKMVTINKIPIFDGFPNPADAIEIRRISFGNIDARKEEAEMSVFEYMRYFKQDGFWMDIDLIDAKDYGHPRPGSYHYYENFLELLLYHDRFAPHDLCYSSLKVRVYAEYPEWVRIELAKKDFDEDISLPTQVRSTEPAYPYVEDLRVAFQGGIALSPEQERHVALEIEYGYLLWPKFERIFLLPQYYVLNLTGIHQFGEEILQFIKPGQRPEDPSEVLLYELDYIQNAMSKIEGKIKKYRRNHDLKLHPRSNQ